MKPVGIHGDVVLALYFVAARSTHLRPQLWVFLHSLKRSCQGFGVTSSHEEAFDTVGDEFHDSGLQRGNHRSTRGQTFGQEVGNAVLVAIGCPATREAANVGPFDPLANFGGVHLADKVD